MPELDRLFDAYTQHVALPWSSRLAAAQRIWFLPYDPDDERRLRDRVGELRNATERAKKKWLEVDVGSDLADWVGSHRYREAFFEDPKDAEMALDGEFFPYLVDKLSQVAGEQDDQTVFAIIGVGSLYGALKVSLLVDRVATAVKGRLLVPFPGRVEGTIFRLLDARDGWNYHATVIAPAVTR